MKNETDNNVFEANKSFNKYLSCTGLWLELRWVLQ